MQKDYLIPLSIVVGCSIIGVGLYMGLHSPSQPGASAPASQLAGGPAATEMRPTSLPSSTGVSPPAVATAAGAPGFPAIPPVQGVPAEVQAAAERSARDALLAEKKTTLIPKCWQPALQKVPQPAVAKYQLDVMFDAQGVQIGRGLHEDRSAMRPDVANCISEQPMTLRLSPPPGIPIHMLLPLEFP